MKKLNLLTITLLAGSLFSSCEKALDPKVDSDYSNEYVWTLPDYAQGILINAYANVPNQFNSYGGDFLDVATDNAVTNNYSSDLFELGSGSLNANKNPIGAWGNAYVQFRNIHLFLENGLTDKITYNVLDPAADAAVKNRLKGEALFLRAWWGFQLLQQYGGKATNGLALGYPIVKSTQEALKSDVTRNTYEECVQQILNDCDAAALLLPKVYAGNDAIVGTTSLGRANKQVAAALKSRVALYAASPANRDNSVTKLNGPGNFTVLDQTAYTDQWKRAVTLSQEAIALIGNFSSLKTSDFNSPTFPNEVIWARYTNNSSLENLNYPVAHYGNAYTGPSQNLVNSFPAKNGFPITDTRSLYSANNPYTNRDPRLDLNVYRNGSVLDTKPIETFVGGRDSKEAYPNNTRTGYYLRKWLTDKDFLLDPQNPLSDYHYNVLLRKTELFLNLAEASNEAYGPTVVAHGSTQSAVTIIKNIRTAAGITSNVYVDEVAAQGKDAFRRLIHNERRLELAFENHRYFDLRRWLLPLSESVNGVQIVKSAAGALQFAEIEVEKRKFNDIKYYYHPLPFVEIAKSPGLINNLGW